MTIWEAIFSAARLPLMGVLFLLLTGQMAVAITAFRDRRSRQAKCAMVASLLLSAVIFWLCLSVIAWEINDSGGIQAPPRWLASFGECPVDRKSVV